MGNRNTLRYCMIVGALALASASGVHAQSTAFTINGRVKVDGGSMDGVKMVVIKNGEKQRTVTSNLSKFTLDLDLNSDYVLSFEKDGFVTKKLSFNTHAPAEAIANGFTPFDFAVSIFKQYDDVNTVVFNQPVGIIRYDAASDDFDYDTDYTKSIQSALAEAIAAVEKKQEEEKGKDENAAKEKDRQERERLKAEAEKQKQDAEQAKLKAKQQKEQDEVARKELERKNAEVQAATAAKRKADEAAAKAEKERLAAAEKPKEAPKPAPKLKPEPPPAPVAKVKPPKPPPAPVVRTQSASGVSAHEGAEKRRNASAKEGAEGSRVQKAKVNALSDAKPVAEPNERPVERHEELIVEPNEVTTLVQLKEGARRSEYRKVVHKYGAVHYFKNGESCSKLVYENEALAETR